MSRHAMIIDLVRCVGCGACVVACEEEWQLPVGVDRGWVRPLLPVPSPAGPLHAHFVGLCNHCGQASCIEACPTGATYRDARGRVVVDAGACIGCGHCVDACPYGARTLRTDVGRVEKCDFCAARVDAGLQPACVETCPAGARLFGDLDGQNPVARAVATGRLRRIETPQVAIDPHVYYAGGDRVVDRILVEHAPVASRVNGAAAAGALRVVRGGFFGLFGLVLAGEALALGRLLLRRRERASALARREDAEPRMRRHDTAAIALHWFNALVWILMAGTGLAMLANSRYDLLPGGAGDAVAGLFGARSTLAHGHIGAGLVWAVVLLGYGVLGFRSHLRPFLARLRLDGADRAWLAVKARRVLLRSGDPLPPQDKYNAGQKLFGLVVALGTATLVVSGLVMLGAPGGPARWAVVLHFAGMVAVLLGLVVHLFMSTVLPTERPALWSMFHGWIPASYAREHNRRWWDRARGPGSAGDDEAGSRPSDSG